MKKISAILTCLAALLCLSACDNPDTHPTEPVPTQPLTKTVYVHTSITQEFGNNVNRTDYLFDEQDWVNQVVVYTNDVETKRYSVTCDSNGNYTQLLSDGSVTKFTYDDQGHSLGIYSYINDSLVSSTEHTWEGDLRTSITIKIAAQNTAQRVLMTYDSSGRLLRQDNYYADALGNYTIFNYGEDGRVSGMTVYQPDGTLSSSSTCAWEGNTETIVHTLPDGTISQIAILTHDEHGNLLCQELYTSKKVLISRETHTWKAIEVPIDCPRASV